MINVGKVKDITGTRINGWTVLEEHGRNKSGGAMFLCRCQCGNERVVDGRSVRNGSSKSCGCTRAERITDSLKLRFLEQGGKKERLYGVWNGMKDRCYNPNSRAYYRYGGRGITVCDEWKNSYKAFRKWALDNGYDSTAKRGVCTLERIDNDDGYSPLNCTWASSRAQCNNRSNNHIISYKGVEHTISEWSRITGIRKDTLRRRLVTYGWATERALQTPVYNRK